MRRKKNKMSVRKFGRQMNIFNPICFGFARTLVVNPLQKHLIQIVLKEIGSFISFAACGWI